MSVTSGQIAGVYDDGVLPVLLPIAVDSQGRLLVSGGGGGGGGGAATSPADIAAGINLSTDINTVVNSLTDLENLSTDIAVDTGLIDTSLQQLITLLNLGLITSSPAYTSVATITRGANTTPYLVNEVYGPLFELANFSAANKHVFLTSVRITFNLTALPSGMGFWLYLYSAPPPTIRLDNDTFSVPAVDRYPVLLTPEGIDLGNAKLANGGGSVVLVKEEINQQFKLATNATSVWGYLVTKSGFTPAAASEVATIVTHCIGI